LTPATERPAWPTPKSLILTIYGAHVRDLGGWLAVSHLLVLMEELGHDAPAVRTAVSRMKRSGLLTGEARDGVAGYALTPAAADILADGDVRIFHSAQAPSLADGWVIAVFSVPEETRERRHRLRSELVRLGFGQVTPGVWLAPRRMQQEVTRVLDRAQLTEHVTIFGGAHLGFAPLSDLVNRAWDLVGLEARYGDFVRAHAGVARTARRSGRRDDRQAFAQYMTVLGAWRRLAYLDPGLPAELLPRGWRGQRARAIFTRARLHLEARAQAHVRRVVTT
jgi:phenylacetic acid degradation operon negative regulatory protein